MKLDSSGAIHWEHYLGIGFGDEFSAFVTGLARSPKGEYVLVGYDEDVNCNIDDDGGDIFLMKIASSGQVKWLKKYPGNGGWDEAFGIESTPDGGYIVVGGTWSDSTSSYDGLILKCDDSGRVVWQEAIGGSEGETLMAIRCLPEGGYLAVGRMASKAWVLRLGEDGSIRWQKALGDGTHQWSLNTICPSGDGACVLAGSGEGIWAVKVDRSGGLIWTRSYADPAQNGVLAAFPLRGGNFLLIGSRLIMKIGPTGELVGARAPRADLGIGGATKIKDGRLLLNAMTANGLQVIRISPSGMAESPCFRTRSVSLKVQAPSLADEGVSPPPRVSSARAGRAAFDLDRWPFRVKKPCLK